MSRLGLPAALFALLLPGTVRALPTDEQAIRALLAAPSVAAARAAVEVERSRAEQLSAGPYEFGLRLDGARRRIGDEGRFGEWAVTLERPLRLPAKAGLDGEIGLAGMGAAEAAYGDAWHEAGRELLRLWFAWAHEQAQAREWRGQAELLHQQLDVGQKRLRAGDAARLELMQIEASLAQAQASLRQAQARADAARHELAHRFPSLPLPAEPPPVDPLPAGENLDWWRRRILSHNHELALAARRTELARLQARRAQADRSPDPTVGLRYAAEVGGAERIVGVVLSLPLPGRSRSAAADAAAAQSQVAELREAEVRQRLDAEAARLYTMAESAHGAWREMQSAADALEAAARLMARAWALGEAGINEVLAARRQARDGALAAALARLDAVEARSRLLLDAHMLWPLPGETGHGAEGN